MTNDPVADLITRLRNAGMARLSFTRIPFSKMKKSLVDVLAREGFVGSVSEKGKGITDRQLEVALVYRTSGLPKINEVKRISKPGRRVYVGYKDLKPVQRGRGIAILSTPNGLVTDKEARKSKIGGELLITVW